MKANEILIREAQLLKTGANNHNTDQLIAMYRGAAKSKNKSAFNHLEVALQEHIIKQRTKQAKKHR